MNGQSCSHLAFPSQSRLRRVSTGEMESSAEPLRNHLRAASARSLASGERLPSKQGPLSAAADPIPDLYLLSETRSVMRC